MRYVALLGILVTATLVACGKPREPEPLDPIPNTLEFDCRREGQNCLNEGTCDLSEGTCSCKDVDHAGYKCQIDVNDSGLSCSPNCFDDLCSEDSTVCVCTEAEYGSDCQFKKFQHACNVEGRIIINANVEGADAVFVHNETACPLLTSGVNMPSGWEGYARNIDISADDECGNSVVTTIDGDVSKVCVTVDIRYRNDYWTDLDTSVTYCCSGTELSDLIVASINVADGLPGTTVQPDGGRSYVDGKILDFTRTREITGSVIIGQVISLWLALLPNAPYVGLKPLSCDLVDDPIDSEWTVPLVVDECATGNLSSILQMNADGTYYLQFVVVRFVTSNSVYIVCNVRQCAVEANCDDECDIGNQRKKRTASTDLTTGNVQPYVAEINVKDPFHQNEEASSNSDETDGKETINLFAAVIGLCVVLFLVLTTCLVLTVCFIKRRSPMPRNSRRVHDSRP